MIRKGMLWTIAMLLFLGVSLLMSSCDSAEEEVEMEEAVQAPTKAAPALTLNLSVGDNQTVFVESYSITKGSPKTEDVRLGLWGVLKILTQAYEQHWMQDSTFLMNGSMDYVLNIDPDGTLRMINENGLSFYDQEQQDVAHNFSRFVLEREMRFPAPQEYVVIQVIIGLKPGTKPN